MKGEMKIVPHLTFANEWHQVVCVDGVGRGSHPIPAPFCCIPPGYGCSSGSGSGTGSMRWLRWSTAGMDCWTSGPTVTGQALGMYAGGCAVCSFGMGRDGGSWYGP
jgi:hypothetical protein